ncbi:hypothetical protein [Novosphingobium sp. ERN07]|uniref:hypothetical protein n=1 Tax=Novosphingobium sp. ERN07 TaxID=2726187 RepID=UPI001F113573|nr:hypothetical protein [Novosphingobium sp. ERN07]
MNRLRRLAFSNRVFACALIALALAMKLAVPAGFMPVMSGGQIVVAMCSGSGPMTMAIAIPGLKQGKSESGGEHDKADAPCAFAGHSVPSLGAMPELLLAVAMAFIVALGLRPLAFPASPEPPYLRLHLRAPPAQA